MGHGQRGVEANRFAGRSFCFLVMTPLNEDFAEVALSVGRVGLEEQPLPISGLRLVEPAEVVEGVAEVEVGQRHVRLEADGGAGLVGRFGIAAEVGQQPAQVVVGQRQVGLQVDGTAEGDFGFLMVPKTVLDVAQADMALGELRVEAQAVRKASPASL